MLDNLVVVLGYIAELQVVENLVDILVVALLVAEILVDILAVVLLVVGTEVVLEPVVVVLHLGVLLDFLLLGFQRLLLHQ